MKKVYLLVLALFTNYFVVNAQIFNLETTAPDSLKRTIEIFQIQPTGLLTVPVNIEGDIYIQSGLACDTIVNPLGKDKIVFIDRGTCTFNIKALAAQRVGAKALVIMNNSATLPGIGAGATGVNNIPVYYMNQSDAASFKANPNRKIKITYKPCASRSYGPEVFWGNKQGEGDFYNGLNGWTTKADPTAASVVWKVNSLGLTHPLIYIGDTARLFSATECNGVANVNFSQKGSTDSPAGSVLYTSELVSPLINCSGKDNIVLSFTMATALLGQGAGTKISFSTDGGNTYSNEITVSSSGVLRSTEYSYPANFLNNQSNVRIKFTVSSSLFNTMLDDVRLSSQKVFNLAINNDFYSIAPNYLTPLNQVEPIAFTIDIENKGNTDITNAKVEMTVRNRANNQIVFADTAVVGRAEVGKRIENIYSNKTFTPAQQQATYTVSYAILGDSLKTKPTISGDFIIGDTTFSKIPTNITRAWKFDGTNISGASYYRLVNDKWPNNKPITLSSVRTGAASNTDLADALLSVDVYEWTNANNDDIAQAAERKLIATGLVIYKDGDGIVTIPLADPNDPSKKVVITGSSKDLLVTTNVEPLNPADVWFIFSSNYRRLEANGAWNTAASSFAQIDAAKLNRFGNFYAAPANNDFLKADYDFHDNIAWLNALNLEKVDLTNVEKLDLAIETNIYPNPASDIINIDLNLNESREFVIISMYNADGRLVKAEKYVDISRKNINLNVSDLPSGIYNLRLSTEKGYTTQKVSVIK